MEGVFFFFLIMIYLYIYFMELGFFIVWGFKSVRIRRVKYRVYVDSIGYFRFLGIWVRCLLGSVF